jgi:hypothetical protein
VLNLSSSTLCDIGAWVGRKMPYIAMPRAGTVCTYGAEHDVDPLLAQGFQAIISISGPEVVEQVSWPAVAVGDCEVEIARAATGE